MDLNFCKLQLSLIRGYEFSATSNKEDGWNGIGQGTVSVEEAGPNSLLFFEDGYFKNAQGKFKTRNTYRWTFKNPENTLSLEHLRFGVEKPVYLFDMVYQQDNSWSSVCPHLCDRDEYNATMMVEASYIRLEWSIVKKNGLNHIAYRYTF